MADDGNLAAMLKEFMQKQEAWQKEMKERLEKLEEVSGDLEDPEQVDQEPEEQEQQEDEEKAAEADNEKEGERTWDFLAADQVLPFEDDALKLLKSLKDMPPMGAIKELLEELPNYEGMLVVPGGRQTMPLYVVQKRMVEIMKACVYTMDHQVEPGKAIGIIAGLARITFGEAERARKVEAVRGRVQLLDPVPGSPPPLLSKEERAAVAKAQSQGGALRRKLQLGPKFTPYRGRGNFRGRANARGGRTTPQIRRSQKK